jgi:HEAT repeat protein
MISRSEFLGLTAAIAASSAVAAQNAPSAAELEAEARKNTPHKSETIMAMDEAGLVRILKDQRSTDFEKAKACQRLAVEGGETAVPALAALLPDPKLSHYARYALEAMPGPESDAALRGALGKLNGNLLIGVMNSIGRRKDTEAVQALAKLRHDADRNVAEAAAAALAEIRRP